MESTVHEPTKETNNAGRRAAWGGVFAMSLGCFALVSSEYMPSVLLTPIAKDLQVSEGQAGQAIAVSGAFAVVTSLLISWLAGRLDRKRLLLILTLVMIASGAVVACAPNIALFILGRALIGITVGGFWSMSAATVMRLVPEPKVSRALAILNGGNALGTVVAMPLGSLLAGVLNWRSAFFCLIAVAGAAFCWNLVSLPSMHSGDKHGLGRPFELLKRRSVWPGMAAVALFYMGQFSLFTYLRPFLETVTGIGTSMLPLMFLIIGVAGFIGTVLVGGALKESFYKTLIFIPALLAIITVLLAAFGESKTLTAIMLGLWGLVATAAPVSWWSWLAKTLPKDSEAGGGLLVAIIQIAVAGGALVGGILFDWWGHSATFTLSAILLVAAAVAAYFVSRNVSPDDPAAA